MHLGRVLTCLQQLENHGSFPGGSSLHSRHRVTRNGSVVAAQSDCIMILLTQRTIFSAGEGLDSLARKAPTKVDVAWQWQKLSAQTCIWAILAKTPKLSRCYGNKIEQLQHQVL